MVYASRLNIIRKLRVILKTAVYMNIKSPRVEGEDMTKGT